MKNISDFPVQEAHSAVILLDRDSAYFLLEALSQVAAKGPQAALLADLYGQTKKVVATFSSELSNG